MMAPRSTPERAERVRPLCQLPAIRKLDALLRDQTGVGLIVLLPQDNEKLEVGAEGRPIALPPFCRTIHAAPGGLDRCITCRSNLAFAAYNRGLVQHACHGGVSVFAAPVTFPGSGDTDIVVVSTCAFTPRDRREGWRRARDHARGLKVDLRALRHDYLRLPSLSGAKLRLVQGVVELAAGIMADALARPGAARAAPPRPRPLSHMESAFREALVVSSGQPFQGLNRPSGAALVEVVAAVVRSNPALPFRASEIARAASLTPNHFSALFRKHTGQSFSTYLVWMRIALAQELLRDLTLSVRAVADRSGFGDANYFARRFKQKTGLTPRAWRSAL